MKVTLDLRHRGEAKDYITYRNYMIATGGGGGDAVQHGGCSVVVIVHLSMFWTRIRKRVWKEGRKEGRV